MKKYSIYFLFFMTGSLLLAACGESYIYQNRIEIPDASWKYKDPVNFEFELTDTDTRYDILLEVIHAGDYGFQNLYVQFHTRFPSGKEASQVVSLELASRSGIWNGTCSGNECTIEIPLQVNAIIEEPGTHRITVEQYMRKSPLSGVIAMRLKVRKNLGNQ